MHVAVVGAGIGGLATAIALQRRGFNVSVYEQAPALVPIGAGIIIASNSNRLLIDEFGIEEVPRAVHPSAIHLRRWQDGSTISRQPLGRTARDRYGADYLALHRADLLDALLAQVDPAALHLGHRVTGLSQSDNGVELRFAEAEPVRADLAVAADGVRSPTAAALGVSTVPRASGYAIYRGMAPAEVVDDLVADLGDDQTAWLGPDRHLVHYPISGGRRFNFGAIVPTTRDESESWTSPGDIAEARAHFATWDRRIRRVLASTETVTLWGLYDRPVRDTMHTGRVALVGDAAHPMLPFFGQGASMAIEDAAVLGVVLDGVGPDELPSRLALYSALRVPRARRVQDISHSNATMLHLPDGPAQRERDQRIASAAGGDPFRDNDWLYAHDVHHEAAAALESRAHA